MKFLTAQSTVETVKFVYCCYLTAYKNIVLSGICNEKIIAPIAQVLLRILLFFDLT